MTTKCSKINNGEACDSSDLNDQAQEIVKAVDELILRSFPVEMMAGAPDSKSDNESAAIPEGIDSGSLEDL